MKDCSVEEVTPKLYACPDGSRSGPVCQKNPARDASIRHVDRRSVFFTCSSTKVNAECDKLDRSRLSKTNGACDSRRPVYYTEHPVVYSTMHTRQRVARVHLQQLIGYLL